MPHTIATRKRQGKSIRGRKREPVNARDVFKLAKIHCTVDEIASFLEISKATIYNRFKTELHNGWQASNIKLRRKLDKMAIEDGNYKVAIWLSKQYLGMREVMPDEATQIQFNVYTNDVPK